jgi:hypothetical protein
MLLELAKPVTLLFCILSLLEVFHTAFLGTTIDIHRRVYDSLALLVLAAGISVISGLVFRESWRESSPAQHLREMQLIETLPVRIFCWATGIMLGLFVAAWYLETHCIFYKDVRF